MENIPPSARSLALFKERVKSPRNSHFAQSRNQVLGRQTHISEGLSKSGWRMVVDKVSQALVPSSVFPHPNLHRSLNPRRPRMKHHPGLAGQEQIQGLEPNCSSWLLRAWQNPSEAIHRICRGSPSTRLSPHPSSPDLPGKSAAGLAITSCFIFPTSHLCFQRS